MKNFTRSDVAADFKSENSTGIFSEDSWAYGWTHYGKTGQTRARMNRATREIEIKDCNKWIKCHPGCDKFFTSVNSSAIPALFSGAWGGRT